MGQASCVSSLSLSKGVGFCLSCRGEDEESYSFHFRHAEFVGALQALDPTVDPLRVSFENALCYNAPLDMPAMNVDRFNEAMQYLYSPYSMDLCIRAAQRCSLLHALYHIEARGASYEDLNNNAMEVNALQDMHVGGTNQNHTWCLRVRHYGEESSNQHKAKRYGARARSIKGEQQALKALEPLLLQLGGRVNLDKPDCQIYVFDGIANHQDRNKLLTRQIAAGPNVSSTKWARAYSIFVQTKKVWVSFLSPALNSFFLW